MEAQVLIAKMQLLGHSYAAKLNSRFLMPFFKNPFGQLVISFGLGYFVTTSLSQIYTKLKGNSEELQTDKDLLAKEEIPLLPKESVVIRLSLKQLAAFDGLNPDQPVYTALNGKIYDLTPGRQQFSNQGLYSHLAGCDANQVLQIACYSMGISADDLINRWEQSLNAEFNIVGFVIEQDMESNGKVTDRSDTKELQAEDDLGEVLK